MLFMMLHISTREAWGFVYALTSLFPEGNFSPCFSYFSTFSAEPKRTDDRRHVFPISLHSVLNKSKPKENLCLLSLFPYI